jgi:glycosyltransferase involved in cell wall biosynthesis
VTLGSNRHLPGLHALPQTATVTVVIPAFNAAAFLAEALDSVLAQTYQPLEIIVVDDGSEDETPQVAAAYASKVTYIRKEHGGGCGGNRNVGIRVASGEWIALLDADDIWMPEMIERLVERAGETGADLVFCDWLPQINGRVVGRSNWESMRVMSRLGNLTSDSVLNNPFELLLEAGCYFSPSSVMIRRDALLQIGLFDESIYHTDDLDLWLRLSLRYRFAVVGEALVLRRIHDHNMSHDTWTVMINAIKTYEKAERYGPALATGTKWRRFLRRRKVPMLRETGAIYLRHGEHLLARKSWAKCFWESAHPRFAAYWLATFLPKAWAQTIRNWKNKSLVFAMSTSYQAQGKRK